VVDRSFSLSKFTDMLQASIDEILANTSPTEWDENHLSFSIVQRLREVFCNSSPIQVENGLIGLNAEAYKITGAIEQTHGDIAIVVHHMFDDRRELRGIGFYEAKASSVGINRYPAFDYRQLRRLVTSTPKLALLLYEQQSSSASSDPFNALVKDFRSDWRRQYDEGYRARTVEANLVVGLKDPNYAAHFYAEPFASHLVSRYLSGKDLDYSRPPLESLKRWLKVTKRSAPIIIAVRVIQADSSSFPELSILPPEIELPSGYEIIPSPTSSHSSRFTGDTLISQSLLPPSDVNDTTEKPKSD
jgi:hypothetical protein